MLVPVVRAMVHTRMIIRMIVDPIQVGMVMLVLVGIGMSGSHIQVGVYQIQPIDLL